MKKRYIFITALFLGVSIMFACSNKSEETTAASQSTVQESQAETGSVEAINQDGSTNSGGENEVGIFEDFNTLEDAAKLAGFEFVAPEKIEGYENRYIQAVKNEMIQVIYDDSSAENSITIRKSNNTKDNTISCDPNQYSYHNEVDAEGVQVTVWGSEEGSVNLATWKNTDYNYSFSLSKAMPESELIEMVKGIK